MTILNMSPEDIAYLVADKAANLTPLSVLRGQWEHVMQEMFVLRDMITRIEAEQQEVRDMFEEIAPIVVMEYLDKKDKK